jgi:hypothetical protein
MMKMNSYSRVTMRLDMRTLTHPKTIRKPRRMSLQAWVSIVTVAALLDTRVPASDTAAAPRVPNLLLLLDDS